MSTSSSGHDTFNGSGNGSGDGPGHGPITKRVLTGLRAEMCSKVVDLAAIREGRELAEKVHEELVPDIEHMQEHPAHAMYMYAHNHLTALAEQLLALPELRPFRQIQLAEEEYMPSWPPMSPISTSYFQCWSTYDFPVRTCRETLGQVTIAVATECGVQTELVALMQTLQDSRMGVYQLRAQEGAQVRLQELSGGAAFAAECPSGYAGRSGELWFARVLPPPVPEAGHVVLTSPYVLRSPGEPAWRAYLERAAGTVPGVSREEALAQHFKWGPAPRYWPEFIFEGYSNHEPGAIFLHGVPDVPASRPHSPHYDADR